MRGLGTKLCLTTVVVHCYLQIAVHHIAAEEVNVTSRVRIGFDAGWRFAFGHASDRSRDFAPGGNEFSYLAKTGFASGAAAPNFDDRLWRELDLPHDWAVEAPFDKRASNSHGSKAIGRNFPERCVGWYRKTFSVPASDLGRRISLEFDGVFRDSQVWVNGHYLGREESGYSSFAYDVNDVLNYGGENVVAVRVDASLEEVWFYEGAGIYRHIWLVKTAPLHVDRHGTFVTAEVKDDSALVTIRASVRNEGLEPDEFQIDHTIVDVNGAKVASAKITAAKLPPGKSREYTSMIDVDQPQLWSLEAPCLYRLKTKIRDGNNAVDSHETPFGIRDIKFDPKDGFFLSGCELNSDRGDAERIATLDAGSFRDGKNVIAIVLEETHFRRDHIEREIPAVVEVRIPALLWKRKLFNGLTQVIVLSTVESGELELDAAAPGLENASISLLTKR